jgi:hypothetical protein
MLLHSQSFETYTLQELEEFWGDELSKLTPTQLELIAWLYECIHQTSRQPWGNSR